MPVGTTERVGGSSSDHDGKDTTTSLASPGESRSSSNVQDSVQQQQQTEHSEKGGGGIGAVGGEDNKSQQSSGGDQDKQTNEFNYNLWTNSPQSTDDGITRESGTFDEPDTTKRDGGSSTITTTNNGGEPFEWTPYAELHLLNSLRGLRPVGANYHIYMNVVHNRFNTAMGIDLPRSELIKKINTYYNFDEALKICGEDVPTNQYPFELPKDEFPAYAELLKRHSSATKKTELNESSKKKPRGSKK